MELILLIFGCVTLIITTVALLGLIVFSTMIIVTERRHRHMPGPKRKSFFLGNINEFLELKEKAGLQSAQIFFMWTKLYGHVYWMRVLWQPFVIAAAPEIVKELLLKSRHPKPPKLYRTFQSLYGARFMGHGLVSEMDHEKWFHRRAIVNPAFRRKYLIGMIDHFNECAEALCDHLLTKADGKTEVEMLNELNNTTLDVIAKIGFSINTDSIGKPDCPFSSSITTILKGMQRLFDNAFTEVDPRSSTRAFRREVRESICLVRETGRNCITERIDARKRGQYVPHDILNVILDASNDLEGDEEFAMENMLDEFVTLFVAGQETTSNLLTFTLVQLGRNPEVAKKLQTEVDDVLGQKPSIRFEDLSKLEYMMRVLKESLRLYPPVVGTTRIPVYPIKYRDIIIPAGTNVSVMSGVMGRMDEYFDDPLLFNPDRFEITDDGKLPRHLYAYFPFSMGQRSCIGQQFALIEARVILGKLLQRFQFHLNQSQRTTMLDELTSKPLDKCKNYITLRK